MRPLRSIISRKAVLSGFSDVFGNEILYDTILYQQTSSATTYNHSEVDVIYMSMATFIIIVQTYLYNKKILDKWANLQIFNSTKRNIKSFFIFIFYFLIRNVETTS